MSVPNDGIEGVLVLEHPRTHEIARVFEGVLYGVPPFLSAKQKTPKQKMQSLPDRGFGEVVFDTASTGYEELITDPSFYGQLITMTSPHIGNTGINLEDKEKDHIQCAGLITRVYTQTPSSWRAKQSLLQTLRQAKVPLLEGVDTRALTIFLRTQGVMRGILLPKRELPFAKQWFQKLPEFEGRDLISSVATSEPYFWHERFSDSKTALFRIAVLDFGVKWNLLRSFQKKKCQLWVLPPNIPAQDILSWKPHGVFLTNGPGDPRAYPRVLETIQSLLGRVPLFGVCMGHQLLAQALGARIEKLKFGHHGGNHPVLDLSTGRVWITSHNHGYAVSKKQLPQELKITHVNLNDQVIEGLAFLKGKAFSVQFHPEAAPGPQESLMLLDRFLNLIEAC